MKTNLPVFRLKTSSVRRRYSDFEWLRGELERDSKVFYIIKIFKQKKSNLISRTSRGQKLTFLITVELVQKDVCL